MSGGSQATAPELDSNRHPAAGAAPANAVLVLGLGNAILCDDAIGLNVVDEVQRRIEGTEGIDVQRTEEMGLCLLDFIAGYRDLVLVDSVQTGSAPPGHLHEIRADDLKCLPASAPHFLGVGETLALGRQLDLRMPERVRIFAIETQEPYLLSTDMTPALQEALPGVVERVLAAARDLARRPGLAAR